MISRYYAGLQGVFQCGYTTFGLLKLVCRDKGQKTMRTETMDEPAGRHCGSRHHDGLAGGRLMARSCQVSLASEKSIYTSLLSASISREACQSNSYAILAP